ncbi:MAG: hypothetical protein IJE60_01840 [Tyzzerella sp.]|nr:hypothetical protein [Tyzzerella sp.]
MDKKKEQLCPTCLTGLNSVRLDPREPFCPFFHLHSTTGCAGYKPITGGVSK